MTVQGVVLGTGEITMTSVNRMGTGKGFDLEPTDKITKSLLIPVLGCGVGIEFCLTLGVQNFSLTGPP